MIDLHCHILPGLDDGPASMDEAMAMAALAEADGVGVIVATPHVDLEGAHPAPATIRALTAELGARLAAAGSRLRVEPGAEVRAGPRLVEALERGELLTLGDRGRALLMEFEPAGELAFAAELVFRLRLAGVTPVLAHGERYAYFTRRPKLLAELAGRGLVVSVNAGSLIGVAGRAVRLRAVDMLNRGVATVIASDGHDTATRPPLLTVARHARGLGAGVFDRATTDGPARAMGLPTALGPPTGEPLGRTEASAGRSDLPVRPKE